MHGAVDEVLVPETVQPCDTVRSVSTTHSQIKVAKSKKGNRGGDQRGEISGEGIRVDGALRRGVDHIRVRGRGLLERKQRLDGIVGERCPGIYG